MKETAIKKQTKSISRIHIMEIMRLTKHLTQLLQAETNLLKQMKVNTLKDLQAEKLALTEKLETHKKLLKTNSTLLEEYTQEERKKFTETVEEFEKALKENYSELTKVNKIHKRIVDSI